MPNFESESAIADEPAILTRERMTFEEFLERAPESRQAEWVNGEMITMTPAAYGHQYLADFLTALIRYFAEHHNLGVVCSAPFLMKGRGGLAGREPDVLFIAREHLDRIMTNYLDGAADLAVEIISPDSRVRDEVEKFHEYAQGGVTEYWLIDPERKRARFFRLADDSAYQPIPMSAEGVLRSVVLPGLWIKTDWLWQEPLPKLSSVLKEWGLI